MAVGGSLLERAIKSTGGKEEFQRKSQQYSESVFYIDKYREKLLGKYDNNWIAVYDSRVVAHAKKYQDVAKEIERKGIPADESVIKFLSSRKIVTLF